MAVPARKGRGAISAPDGRFTQQSTVPDAEEAAAQQEKPLETQLIPMHAGRIISNNTSPDVPFDRSINPYLGCEHGCVYCYARPSHSYLDLSPGLDFETRIYYKPNAVERLLDAWQKPGYRCEPITIGANTDPYQPGEKQLELTRRLLQAFRDYRHPVNIISKSHLIERDLDILSDLAADRLASIAISIPTMDDALKRIMEPRVPAAPKRLAAISRLADAGVPVSTLIAPVIPAINDHEIEALLNAAAKAGAQSARYIMLRLPHELEALFTDWLKTHFPERAKHVLSLLRQVHGGRTYDSRFGIRQSGRGPYAAMIGARFKRAARRAGLADRSYQQSLDCSRFLHPAERQLGLGF